MGSENLLREMNPGNRVSRRTFIRCASALTVACSVEGVVRGAVRAASGRRILAYIGTDTSPVDGAANGKGIYLFEQEPATGRLSQIKLAAATSNPTWMVFHPSGNFLYAIHEVENYQGKNGAVSAFAVNRGDGDLRLLNTVSSQGAGPAYLSLDAAGKYAFVANYFGGNMAVLPIRPDGSLAAAVDIHQDHGSLGSLHATDGRPGSFAISGHDAPHVHMILPDPQNRYVLQTDLGQDRIYVYRFDRNTGKLTPASTPFVQLPSGDGPRHFAFHPNGRWMYSIQEEASTVVFFLYNAETGALAPQQTISALPDGFTGTNFCSEIMVSRDGRFLYGANRLHNSIVVFSIGSRGRLKRLGESLTLGDYPSYFTIDPRGSFLYACNQRSDQITSFRIDKQTGLLHFTGEYIPLGSPMCMVFLP